MHNLDTSSVVPWSHQVFQVITTNTMLTWPNYSSSDPSLHSTGLLLPPLLPGLQSEPSDAFFCCFHIVTDGSSPGDTSHAQGSIWFVYWVSNPLQLTATGITRSSSPIFDNPPLALCTLPSFALEPPSSSPPKAPSTPVGSTALWPPKL